MATASSGSQMPPSPEPTMGGMETTASFERHLVEAENEIKRTTEELDMMKSELKQFEEQVARDKEEQEEMVFFNELEIQDLGRLLEENEAEREFQTVQGEWLPEKILGRRVKGEGKSQRIFYKVKWQKINCVSWELEQDIIAPKLIKEFDDQWLKKAFPLTKKLRPVWIKPPRGSKPNPEWAGDRKKRGTWSCEIQDMVMVPYEESIQAQVEKAYVSSNKEARVMIRGQWYTINFERLTQERWEPGASSPSSVRRVQRNLVLPADEERTLTEGMSLEELRRYIANIVEFTPLHYDLLTRLHELDKVVVSTSADVISRLKKMTFEGILNKVAEGEEFPGFTPECRICLDDYEPNTTVLVLPCGHFFHDDCVKDYLKKYNNNCPVCKKEVE